MIRQLRLITTVLKAMASLFERIVTVISGKEAEIAELKQKLADAMADDAADDEAIAAAQADADAARVALGEALAKVEPLQALADADAAEDAKISEYLAGFEPQPEEPVEEEPGEEEPGEIVEG
jgi:ABC-type transporter Mla subunit MlaD